MDGLEGLFCRYKRLIGYAATRYHRVSNAVDHDDLFQEGCVFLLEYFHRNPRVDELSLNTFKKGLFLYLHRLALREIRLSKPAGRTLLHIRTSCSGSGRSDFEEPNDPLGVHIDDMLAVADTHVLMRIYAQEFKAELRRVLRADDRELLDMLIDSVDDDEPHGLWVKTVAAALGISISAVYNKLKKIRTIAIRVLNRAA